MDAKQVKRLSEAMASMLLSHAAHGLATGSLEGTGEITLRDGLIVAASAEGARTKQAWIIRREVVPANWNDSAVDLLLQKQGKQEAIVSVGGVELKWWRQVDGGNSSNRRRDLIKDFIRAASLASQVEAFALVALLATEDSWKATTKTEGKDRVAMAQLSSIELQKWDLRKMKVCPAVEAAMRTLQKKVQMPNIFHTELLCHRSLKDRNIELASARIWKVKKPQNTKMLAAEDLENLLPPKPAKGQGG